MLTFYLAPTIMTGSGDPFKLRPQASAISERRSIAQLPPVEFWWCSHSAMMNRSIVVSHPGRWRRLYRCRSPCPVGSPWAAVSAGAGMSRTRGCRHAKSRKPPTSMAAGDKTDPATPTSDQRLHHAGAPRKYGLSVSSNLRKVPSAVGTMATMLATRRGRSVVLGPLP